MSARDSSSDAVSCCGAVMPVRVGVVGGVRGAEGRSRADALLVTRAVARVAPAARSVEREERRLVRDAQAGSRDAVEALFERHWDALYRAAFLVIHDRAAAEDIAQEAFLAALRALDRFDRRRPLRPWLHRIAVNRAIDFARARSLRREVSAEEVADHEANSTRSSSFDAVTSPRHTKRGSVDEYLTANEDASPYRLGAEHVHDHADDVPRAPDQ